jgi:hypothetical protein
MRCGAMRGRTRERGGARSTIVRSKYRLSRKEGKRRRGWNTARPRSTDRATHLRSLALLLPRELDALEHPPLELVPPVRSLHASHHAVAVVVLQMPVREREAHDRVRPRLGRAVPDLDEATDVRRGVVRVERDLHVGVVRVLDVDAHRSPRAARGDTAAAGRFVRSTSRRPFLFCFYLSCTYLVRTRARLTKISYDPAYSTLYFRTKVLSYKSSHSCVPSATARSRGRRPR